MTDEKDNETRTDNLEIKAASVKAVGDWELDVLAVPFGGPNRGKDTDGEYFSNNTDLYHSHFKSPLVTYYHGYDPEGNPQGTPEIIGNVKENTWEKRGDGWWVRVGLDKLSQYASRVWEAAKEGIARASSGSITHLVRKAPDGEILKWPIGELSIFDTGGNRQPANSFAVAMPVMKAVYEKAGYQFPDIQPGESEPEVDAKGVSAHRAETVQAEPDNSEIGVNEMENDEVKALVAESVAEALKADREAHEAQEAAEKAVQDRIDAAKAEAVEAAKTEWAEGRRLPSGKDAPYIAKYQETWKYDNLDAADQALMVGILGSVTNDNNTKPSEHALKALALKLDEDKSRVGVMGRQAMKMAGIDATKANDLNYATYASYGDEWVGVAYSQALWDAIRVGTFVANNIPSIEVPPGHESISLPIEGGDPTFYKVAEATADNASIDVAEPTVTNSKLGTGAVSLTLAKMGARVGFSGEMVEDSLIPFVSQLRKQLQVAGAENLEHVIIDGDVATGASSNIHCITSTPAGTEVWMLFDGFRVSALDTTTANSRAGGVITTSDFLETLKLMGTAGINALDINKCAFIMDVNTHWKVSELPEVLTRDVFTQATLEGGLLKSIFGYPVYGSPNMHKVSSNRKVNATGGYDTETSTNNAYGALLAVRWDQWLLGYRRRMTLETTRYPRSDSSEIVALMRLGLIQRDTEASAISFGLTV